MAVVLRLGLNVCVPHQCPCGADVDAWGHVKSWPGMSQLPRHWLTPTSERLPPPQRPQPAAEQICA